NDAPVGIVDNYAVEEGKIVIRGSVLANDFDGDSDPLSVAQFAVNATSVAVAVNGINSITTALGGTVTMNADGTFSYTAPIRHHGENAEVDSFVYRTSDGSE